MSCGILWSLMNVARPPAAIVTSRGFMPLDVIAMATVAGGETGTGVGAGTGDGTGTGAAAGTGDGVDPEHDPQAESIMVPATAHAIRKLVSRIVTKTGEIWCCAREIRKACRAVRIACPDRRDGFLAASFGMVGSVSR